MAQARFLPRRKHARPVGLLLALALVFAQFGAVAHDYSHLRLNGDSQGIAAKTSHSCPDCQSFSPVLGGAGAASTSLTLSHLRADTVYQDLFPPLVAHTPQHAFRSRAPPLLS
jgi:hypothetical protein